MMHVAPVTLLSIVLLLSGCQKLFSGRDGQGKDEEGDPAEAANRVAEVFTDSPGLQHLDKYHLWLAGIGRVSQAIQPIEPMVDQVAHHRANPVVDRILQTDPSTRAAIDATLTIVQQARSLRQADQTLSHSAPRLGQAINELVTSPSGDSVVTLRRLAGDLIRALQAVETPLAALAGQLERHLQGLDRLSSLLSGQPTSAPTSRRQFDLGKLTGSATALVGKTGIARQLVPLVQSVRMKLAQVINVARSPLERVQKDLADLGRIVEATGKATRFRKASSDYRPSSRYASLRVGAHSEAAGGGDSPSSLPPQPPSPPADSGSCSGISGSGRPESCPSLNVPRLLYKIGDEADRLLNAGQTLEGICMAWELLRRAEGTSDNNTMLHKSIAAFNIASGLYNKGCKELACSQLMQAYEWRKQSRLPKRIGTHCQKIASWGCGAKPADCP
jgi:hypothetical protein